MKQLLCISLLLLLFSCSHANKEIVAEVNDETILLSDLSEASKQELFDLLNMAYEIKSKVLDDLIKKKLLDKEAKKQKIKEFIKENQGRIVTGVVTFAGFIAYTINKIKK